MAPVDRPADDNPVLMRRKYVIVVGIMLLLTLYFWGHNVEPGRTALVNGLLATVRVATDLGIVAVLLICGGTIGRFALHRLIFTRISLLERLILEALTGLGIISLLAVMMGLLGLFNLAIWGAVLLATVVSFRYLRPWLGDVRRLLAHRGEPLTFWERLVRYIVVGLLLAALLIALAPPAGWDAIYYHLVIPQRYIEMGVIAQQTDLHFFGFPQNMEMLYGLLMMITGTGSAPAVLHWMMGVLSFLAVGALIRRYASRGAAYTAMLVMIGSYTLWLLFGWAYVDLALMAYGAAVLIALVEWHEDDPKRVGWLALAGLVGGMAAGVKYTAAPLILAMVVFVIWQNPRGALRNLLVLGLFGTLAFAPWMLKGVLLYDNPVYPYIFDGPNWDDVSSINFSETGKGLLNENGLLPLQLPVLPLAATIVGVDKITPYRFTAGPFLLTLPFLLLAGWAYLPARSRTLARAMLPLALISLLYWVAVAALTGIGGQTRLMLVALPIVAVLGGLAYHSLEQMPTRPLNVLFIVQATIIVGLFLGSFDFLNLFAKSRVLEYQAGVIDEDTYLLQNLGLHYQAMQQLETLPADSNIQFLWEDKSYYCPQSITCHPDGLYDAWGQPIRQGVAPEDVLSQWRAEGITHILLYDVPSAPDGYSLWLDYHDFAREQNELFPDYFFDDVEEIWSDGVGYTLYTWQDAQD